MTATDRPQPDMTRYCKKPVVIDCECPTRHPQCCTHNATEAA